MKFGIGFKILLGMLYVVCLVDLSYRNRALHDKLAILVVITAAVCGIIDSGKRNG